MLFEMVELISRLWGTFVNYLLPTHFTDYCNSFILYLVHSPNNGFILSCIKFIQCVKMWSKFNNVLNVRNNDEQRTTKFAYLEKIPGNVRLFDR